MPEPGPSPAGEHRQEKYRGDCHKNPADPRGKRREPGSESAHRTSRTVSAGTQPSVPLDSRTLIQFPPSNTSRFRILRRRSIESRYLTCSPATTWPTREELKSASRYSALSPTTSNIRPPGLAGPGVSAAV